MTDFKFTFAALEDELKKCQSSGYQFITCKQFYDKKKENQPLEKRIVLRVDVDLSVKKAARFLDIFKNAGVKATFFIRLHAPEYNPFSFENYQIIREMVRQDHEIGYHSEIVDQAQIWNEDPADCLVRDVEILSRYFGISIHGVASHGGATTFNNLDFWKNRKPSEFGLLYEGYDAEPEFGLFYQSLYVSDSETGRWKCYENGVRNPTDRRRPSEHAAAGEHPVINLLVHPDKYFDRHVYEHE